MSTAGRPLADLGERERFIRGLASNFGVIAPAGVGKTHSIVSRIAELAKLPDAVEQLSTLVVVTYTNRAAQEMQRRARAAILAEARGLDILSAFNRAFFGTIHSFCLRLLQSYGHTIGVSGRAQLLEDDTELWGRFAQKQGGQADYWKSDAVRQLLRHVPVTTIFALARDLDPRTPVIEVTDGCPDVNARALLDFVPENKRAQKKIEQDQAALTRWLEGLRNGDEFLPLLAPSSSSKPFTELWCATMEPMRRWLGRITLYVAAQIARDYQIFRATSGFVTFQDQITLAAELLAHPTASRQIRRENYRIILDEAQDTDPEQFFVLLEATKDAENPSDQPRPGHFAMVGDHQQSIYGKRADLAVYQKLHRELTGAATGEEAKFTVTFRCAERVVDFVNGTFSRIFSGEGGQVPFVPLQARPDAPLGQVVRLPIALPEKKSEEPEEKRSDAELSRMEAKQVAAFIRENGLAGLRAREWGQVAILCPRKLWFAPLMSALKEVGIPCQLHSMREIAGDSPVYAWFTALTWVMAHPRDSYEVVGVLRDIFGISDHDLAMFADECDGGFQIAEVTAGSHPVAQRLNQLTALRSVVAELPLRDAANRMVRETQLRERLQSLPLEATRNEIDAELDDLLIYAAMVEAEDGLLHDFAQRLKDGFHRPRETDVTRRDALQLMTCQKAKGLEWDAVIVPFLFRKIRSASPRYPACWKEPGATEPAVLLSGDDADESLKETSKRAIRQELERLLYVTCTRPRQSLVLVDDRALFDGKAEDYSATCFGNLLIQYEEGNLPVWEQLHEVVQPERGDKKAGRVAQEELDFGLGERIADEAVDVELVRQRASDFPLRVTPHALAKQHSPEEPEARMDREEELPRVDAPTPATIYGIWWHGLMESLPWNEPMASWESVFERALENSIDPERSRTEWALFKKSDLARQLNQKDWIFQLEMPFLWKASESQVIEGVMDMAVYDPATDQWLVVDWKTNRLGSRGADELVDIYRAQIEAYLRALGELFQKPVRGILYSTTLGVSRGI